MPVTALKLLSSMAPREALAELAHRYAQDHGQTVNATAGGGVDVAKRMQADEPVDVVVLADNAIDALLKAGKVLPPRLDLMKSGIAIAVRHGAPHPDIGNEAAIRQAVLAAPSVSYSTGPSGVYLEQLFARWGILDAIKPRIVVPPPGVPVGSLVAGGQCALGFQQLSELMNLRGIDVLGPLPAEIQLLTVFSGAVAASSAQPAAASELLRYLAAPAASALKQQYGMEPAQG